MTATPLRVLVAHPSGDLYGADAMLLESVSGMVNAGFEVRVALAEAGPLRHRLARAGAEVAVVPTVVVRKSLMSLHGGSAALKVGAGSMVTLIRVLRQWRPQVMYVNTVTLPLWVYAARVVGIPVVVHVHEAESHASPALRQALLAPLRCAHRVLATSAYSAATITADLPRCASRIALVTNGVRTSVQPPATRVGAVKLGFLGRWSPRKGVHLALAVHRELRRRGVDTHLAIAGSAFPGYEWYPEGLQSSSDDAVTWVGRVDDAAVFFRDVEIVLVPSVLPEPYGNVAVEALGAGRAVVASRCGGLPEAVAGARAVCLAPVGDVGAWADAVHAMVCHRERYATLAREDAPRVARRHRVDHYHSRVCDEVLRAASAGARHGG